MKKICVVLLILICPFMFFACQSKSGLKDNISEITKVYFQGKDNNNENIKASISVGQRENPYIIDGFHSENCDFSLFVVNFNKVLDKDEIQAKVVINGEEKPLIMFYNPVNGAYMADLGYSIGEDDEVELIYNDYSIIFQNISNNFEVNYEDALTIATQTLSKQIEEITDTGNFLGECYLKILTKQDGNFDKLFWFFNIVTQKGDDYGVVISVDDGNTILTN